jgi:hypothetical protein
MAMTGEKTRLRPDFFDFSGCRHRRCPLSARSGACAAPFWETKSVFVTTNSVFVQTKSLFVMKKRIFRTPASPNHRQSSRKGER